MFLKQEIDTVANYDPSEDLHCNGHYKTVTQHYSVLLL